MRTETAFDAALATRWSEAAAISRSIAAAATAIAAVPPLFGSHAPGELPALLTSVKMQMLSWPITIAPELVSLAARIADAGDLAPMLDCDLLEQQLAAHLEASRVDEGLGSVVGLVANIVRGQRPSAEALLDRIRTWRGKTDEMHEQLLAIRGDLPAPDSPLRGALDRLGASIGRFGAAGPATSARPRAVLAWLSNLEAVAFAVVADDDGAAGLTADREVLDACRNSAEAYAATAGGSRWQVLLDGVLELLHGASEDAGHLAHLTGDTAAAWLAVEERLSSTASETVPGQPRTVRTLIAQAQRDVQCVSDVRDVFRSAAIPCTAIVPEAIHLRSA